MGICCFLRFVFLGGQKLGWCKLQHSQTNCLSWNIISSLHLPQQQQQQQQKISPCVLKSLVQAEDTAASFATPLCSSSSSGHSSRKKTPTWELFAIAQEGVESMELPPTPAPGNGSVAQPSKDKGDSRGKHSIWNHCLLGFFLQP
jgi:hypothetical protein